jgi:hypothetical protein
MARIYLTVAASLLAFTAGEAVAASTTATASSSAFSATFSVAGAGSQSLAAQLPATVTVPPAKTVKNAPANPLTINKTYFGAITISGTITKVSDVAQGSGLKAGVLTAGASSTLTTSSVTAVAQGSNIFSASSNSVASTAAITKKNGTPTTSTTTTISGLTFSSSVFGINLKNKSYNLTKQKIIGQNTAGTAFLIANHTTPIKTGSKIMSAVDALDLHLVDFSYGPYKISGDVALGTSSVK